MTWSMRNTKWSEAQMTRCATWPNFNVTSISNTVTPRADKKWLKHDWNRCELVQTGLSGNPTTIVQRKIQFGFYWNKNCNQKLANAPQSVSNVSPRSVKIFLPARDRAAILFSIAAANQTKFQQSWRLFCWCEHKLKVICSILNIIFAPRCWFWLREIKTWWFWCNVWIVVVHMIRLIWIVGGKLTILSLHDHEMDWNLNLSPFTNFRQAIGLKYEFWFASKISFFWFASFSSCFVG